MVHHELDLLGRSSTCGCGQLHAGRRGEVPRLGSMSLEWAHVIVHTAHPVELGQWWADALSWAVVWQSEDEYSIRPAPDQRPGLTFVTMRDAKVTKNRLHLDFYPDSQTAEVDRLLAMGAQRADVGQGSQSWVVLADPERNEFCILESRSPIGTQSAEGTP
jgi:hypothetical protein